MWRDSISTLQDTVQSDASPIRIRMPEDRASRRIYFAAVVDDCPQYTLISDLLFTLRGSPVLRVPVMMSNLGIGQYSSDAEDVVLPIWNVNRRPYGSGNFNLDNFSTNHRSTGADLLQSAWAYSDGSNFWNYICEMSPFRLVGTFDQVEWKLQALTGTLYSAFTMLAVTLAVISE